MTRLSATALELDRCPHCRVANPLLRSVYQFETVSSNSSAFQWHVYVCSRCGLPVLGGCGKGLRVIASSLIFPRSEKIQDGLPKKAEAFLRQAMECIHSPSGAIMLCASSVDAMLKEKGFKTGSLYSRIEKAEQDNLITKEMSLWAHEVRLDANDERHADETADLPREADAKRCIDFVRALADFLFVLPARIAKGRTQTKALQ